MYGKLNLTKWCQRTISTTTLSSCIHAACKGTAYFWCHVFRPARTLLRIVRHRPRNPTGEGNHSTVISSDITHACSVDVERADWSSDPLQQTSPSFLRVANRGQLPDRGPTYRRSSNSKLRSSSSNPRIPFAYVRYGFWTVTNRLSVTASAAPRVAPVGATGR